MAGDSQRAIAPSQCQNNRVRRTDLMDTSEWAHHEMVRRLRRLTPSQRIQMVIEHIEFGRQMKAAQTERMKKKPCR